MSALLFALLMAATEPSGPTPLSNPGDWISTDDYPKAALEQLEEGTVNFALDIDSRGVITSCWVTFSSGSGPLDAATCGLITNRAKFKPAKDSRGRSVAGQYQNRVVWKIPDPTIAMKSWSIIMKTMISGQGEVLSCDAIVDGTPQIEEPCEGLNKYSPQMLLVMRGVPGPAAVDTLVQFSLKFDDEKHPSAYLESGRKVTNLVSVDFQIDADGMIQNCHLDRSEGTLALVAPDCKEMMPGGFGVADADSSKPFPRHGSLLMAYAVKEPTKP